MKLSALKTGNVKRSVKSLPLSALRFYRPHALPGRSANSVKAQLSIRHIMLPVRLRITFVFNAY